MNLQEHRIRKERGAAALELAVAAPLLIIVGALCLNMGTYVHAYLSAQAAATAGARYVMEYAEDAPSQAQVQAYLSQTFPDLAFGTSSSVSAFQKSAKQTIPYTYRLFESGTEHDLSAEESYQDFTLTVTVRSAWPALAKLMGEDGTFSVNANASGTLDCTNDAQWKG